MGWLKSSNKRIEYRRQDSTMTFLITNFLESIGTIFKSKFLLRPTSLLNLNGTNTDWFSTPPIRMSFLVSLMGYMTLARMYLFNLSLPIRSFSAGDVAIACVQGCYWCSHYFAAQLQGNSRRTLFGRTVMRMPRLRLDKFLLLQHEIGILWFKLPLSASVHA